VPSFSKRYTPSEQARQAVTPAKALNLLHHATIAAVLFEVFLKFPLIF
jgi:hypothetical protein